MKSKKVLIWIGIGIFVVLGLISVGSNNTSISDTKNSQAPTVSQPQQRLKASLQNTLPRKEADVPLSNNNYYINSRGNEVHSPVYAPSRPVGASARCRDGTYSFSQSRRGTCSHHGGVAGWY